MVWFQQVVVTSREAVSHPEIDRLFYNTTGLIFLQYLRQ